MAIPLASAATVCSTCGEPLNAKGDCVACLLRNGLNESRAEADSPASLVFGDFEVAQRDDGSLWELGRGGMGVTYLASDKVLRRRVALKVIQLRRAARTSQAVRERFLREARAAAALRHPNVAAVFQFGASSDGSRCYYAMELVEGETLETRVRRDGPLDAKSALEIAIQITRALMAAAAQGLIHRDLKPSNIMLTRGDGDTAEMEVKVIDFGLAKALADAGGEDLTRGEFVGTPNFASPEQFGSGPVDVRSDIYSLGATLWFALTGKPPFAERYIEEIRSAQKSNAVPIGQLVAARVPSRLRSLLKSMLAFEPGARPGIKDLAASLQRCSAKEIALEIAHVLFIDIVGFSKLSINEQQPAVEELTQIVRSTEQFQKAEATDRLIKIATGDGMALVFYTSPEAPVRCAIEISRALKDHQALPIRIGVHSGPVSGVMDVTGRANLTGAGLNVANRVMECGDAGHILLSKHAAEDLSEFEEWRPLLRDLGTIDVKHGMKLHAVNLYSDEFGRRDIPTILRQQRRRTARIRWLTAAAAMALAAIFAGVIVFSRNRPPLAQAEPEKSIAVLPLENHSSDAAQEYFADGMTDALITELAKVRALRVMSHASVVQYKQTNKPLGQIGRELNVDAVLAGSVTRSGDHARLAVQLTDPGSNRILWTESYDRDLRELLTLQKEVARDIVSEIRVQLTPQEQLRLSNTRPVNPEAYDNYLRGQFYFHQQTRESNEAAIGAFERAVGNDPSFAAAHAALAQAYVWKLFLFSPNERKLAENAFVEIEKALALDPNLGLAYLARGRLLWTPANRFPHEKAIREYRRALDLDPSLDEAQNQLALVYCHVGLFEEALQQLRRAVAINPNNNLAQFRIGDTLLFQGKYEEALTVLRSVPPEVNPSLIGNQIAMTLLHLGRNEEAADTLDRLLRDFPEDNRGLFTSVQAIMAALEGNAKLAEEKIATAIQQGKGFGHFHHAAYHIACAYALMNKIDNALRWLEHAADHGFPCYPLFIQDSMLNNLRQDPRFDALMARLKTQWENYRRLL